MTPMLVEEILLDAAARFPDKRAVVCGGRSHTYAEIERASSRLAGALAARGLKRGDRVGLHLANSIEMVIGIFAVLKAGGVFVAINHTVKPDKLLAILGHCEARALVLRAGDLTGDLDARIHQELPRLSIRISAGKMPGEPARQLKGWLDFEAAQSEPLEAPRRGHIDLDLACLIYTSGSTGAPKAVMCDHSAMVFATDRIRSYLKNDQNDVVLSVLPLSYSYGLYQLLAMVRSGGALVLENSFSFPAVIMEKLVEERVTGLPGVPTMFALMSKMDLTRYDLSSLRYMTNAAAALPPSQLLDISRRLPHVQFFSMHGLTEVVRTVFLDPQKVARKPDSVGQAMLGTEIWLEDETGRRVGPGEVGEMIVRGRNVMRGYWGDPAGSAERFRPGRHGERLCYSGDLFRMDEEGDFYFVSRKDDIIKTRGEKVSPREIENVICSLPGVVEAAVIGVPDPVLGQSIKAVIVSRDHLSPAQVLSHCRARLEDYMIPRVVEFRDELPKTASGKIVKRNLE